MECAATTEPPEQTEADTIVLGAFDDERVRAPALQALLDSGEAKTSAGSLGLAHVDGRRYLLAGLGVSHDFDAEAARVAAARVAKRAGELGARTLAWELPRDADDALAAAIVEGTVLASYRFDRYLTAAEERPAVLDSLTLCGGRDHGPAAARAKVIADAVNAARVLQDTPGNDMTPTDLADRARALAAAHPGLVVEVERRDAIEQRGMGAFTAVARGSAQEPALITMRYSGPQARGPLLGFVGKAVTFDSGGISLKPGAGMEEMKFDMSGGAAVIEAVGAIAQLQLPVRILAVIGATENMPSDRSVKPGDIVRTLSGKTVEINNTDAEGRLVLADCLAYAIAEGAERLVDLATLTGAIVVALGSTHAGLMSNDDDWADAVAVAAAATGELVWRMPLHAEYAKLAKGTYGDLNNAPDRGKAGAITAAEFLAAFVEKVPWVHLDIAGTGWDLGRAYAEKGGSGFGVRLLIELAGAGT